MPGGCRDLQAMWKDPGPWPNMWLDVVTLVLGNCGVCGNNYFLWNGVASFQEFGLQPGVLSSLEGRLRWAEMALFFLLVGCWKGG